ncbi:hypothetical protein LNAOJCKE_4102 [Methylorubrum aminovorans]|uniref:HTH luxR-type domain-containing protein n=1 Tax=Methylorubrum aminovorans TaxID=269069 RepID=A0ABQ4UJV4_9HYPH|nr:helix-turn-helix transcriptional regulator [Methylorubrum aminovorans]GJE66878.1 hypothetical protein LNAOJCKE_4102 [Methylorubrum aminovorans]
MMRNEAFFRKLGLASRAIGSEQFYPRLLELFAEVLKSQSGWVLRYSRYSRPDVLHTASIAQPIIDYYLSKNFWSEADPYYRMWLSNQSTGILTLNNAVRADEYSSNYVTSFQAKAGFADEMAMFFPTIGSSCIALFLERGSERYDLQDEALAKQAYFAFEGLHRAHVARLLGGLGTVSAGEARTSILRDPSIILDRNGRKVCANPGWLSAERNHPELSGALTAASTTSAAEAPIGDAHILRCQALDADFALAPGGRICVLERSLPKALPSMASRQSKEHASACLAQLTPRERDLVRLVMSGKTTGEIAQELEISKGTVKNHTIRMYKKLGLSKMYHVVDLFYPIKEEIAADF